MTTEATPIVFNPFDPEFRKNPYPTYHRLLAEGAYGLAAAYVAGSVAAGLAAVGVGILIGRAF